MNHATQAVQTRQYAADATMPPPNSAVGVAQAHLDNNIEAVHGLLNTLESRLQPVLGPQPPEPGNKVPGQIRPVASTVSQRIVESTERVDYAAKRLSALLDRLEV
jgi:hypothetical protein